MGRDRVSLTKQLIRVETNPTIEDWSGADKTRNRLAKRRDSVEVSLVNKCWIYLVRWHCYKECSMQCLSCLCGWRGRRTGTQWAPWLCPEASASDRQQWKPLLYLWWIWTKVHRQQMKHSIQKQGFIKHCAHCSVCSRHDKNIKLWKVELIYQSLIALTLAHTICPPEVRNTCRFINEASEITVSKSSAVIKHHSSWTTAGVVYCVSCQRRNQLKRETKRRAANYFCERLHRGIINNILRSFYIEMIR